MDNRPHRIFYVVADILFVVPLAAFLIFVGKQVFDLVVWLKSGSWPEYSAEWFVTKMLHLPLPATGWGGIDNAVLWLLSWPADTVVLAAALTAWLVVMYFWLQLGEAVGKLFLWAGSLRQKTT